MKRCYIFDIDGTIANIDHRLHHITGKTKDWSAFYSLCAEDQPIPHMIELAHHLERLAPVLFVTGRSEECREATATWLHDQGFGVHFVAFPGRLHMRPSGDHRPDNIVKGEMLDAILSVGWAPIMAFEDRTQVVEMFRARGIPCAQVAPGDF